MQRLAASVAAGERERRSNHRFCWPRDTLLVLHAFTDVGYARNVS